MKNINSTIIYFILFIFVTSCAGYEPIFSSSNLKFQIANYKIKGDRKLGNQIYSKLFNLSNLNKNNPEAKSLYISMEITKEKHATVKNSAGKILEYKISLNSNITIKDFLTRNEILTQNLNPSLSYKVQDQYSETVVLEKKTEENLINKIYENLIIKMSENI
tara:strand:- start:701 stop:1186 length:486 start_codon:yes stop_codon:yes gene_type:complete